MQRPGEGFVIGRDDDPVVVESRLAGSARGALGVIAEQEETVESELAGEASELFVGGGGGVPELAHLTDTAPPTPKSRHDVVAAMLPYIDRELADGTLLKHISRHMLGLFAGQPGARAWRRYLSEHAHRKGADSSLLTAALAQLPVAA